MKKISSPLFYTRQKRPALYGFLCAVILLLSFCLLTTSCQLPDESSESNVSNQPLPPLTVHFIDVGQADCILIQTPESALLVDTGDNGTEQTVLNYLKKQGVAQLDYLIGTHPHADHIGGLAEVIRAVDIETLILPNVTSTTRTFEDAVSAMEEKNLEITLPYPGDVYTLSQGDAPVSFMILAPNEEYGDDLNDWSVGIRLTCGDISFVMAGDAESKAEEDMCANQLNLSANVLKLGHHGSRTSTSLEFLEKVAPADVVISCGAGNDYGHPHKETVQKLEAYGARIFRTDQQGTLIATTDGKALSWNVKPAKDYSANRTAIPDSSSQTSSPDSLSSGLSEETTSSSTSSQEPQNVTYILNTSSKKFHLPTCGSASDIKEENRQEVSTSREDLIAQGLEPCKRCNP